MGLRQKLSRRSTIAASDALGMGASDREDGEDGSPYLTQELAELRWAAQTEAVNLARRGVDPTRWDGGRVYFDIERALAHSHEALRDKLANIIGARVRDESAALITAATQVAVTRNDLVAADETLATVALVVTAADANVRLDRLESARFARLVSPRYRAARIAIAAIFILTEFIISGLVFDKVLRIDIPGLGYLFAIGLMVLLVVVPHYAAQGLKEGITHYHQYERDDLIARNQEVTPRVTRGVHLEERDDRGFRILSIAAMALLAALIFSLAWLRAQEMPDPFVLWFLFFAFLQVGISGYFFLREWLDYGIDSSDLIKQFERQSAAQAERDGLFEDYATAVEEYLLAAEPLAMTIQQAPRWDSFVVENYNATIRYMRHLVSIEQPEAEQFIAWAAVPYLGSAHDQEPAGYKLEPTSAENHSLGLNDLRGREHWYRIATKALEEAGAHGDETGVADQGATRYSWYVERNPRKLLSELLIRFFDLPAEYVATQTTHLGPMSGDPAETLPVKPLTPATSTGGRRADLRPVVAPLLKGDSEMDNPAGGQAL